MRNKFEHAQNIMELMIIEVLDCSIYFSDNLFPFIG